MQGHPRRPGHSGEFWQNVVQEATLRTRPKTTDWFQIGKGVQQARILSTCLFNLYAVCSPWGCEELDTAEWLHFHFSFSWIREGNGNLLQCSCLENPRQAEPDGLPSVGLHRVRHDWSDLAAAAAAAYIMWNAGLGEAQAGIKIPGEISVISDMQMIPL